MTGEITAQQDPAVGPPGGWLRRRREAAGLTQEELAEQAGLSVRTIRNLESGAGQPQLRSMRSLTAALGLPETVMSQLIVAYRGGPGNDPGIAPGGAAPPEAARPPHQLPPVAAHFTGRAAELSTLDGWLGRDWPPGGGPTAPIFAIGGMAGVGKTTLAIWWAHQVAGDFPDGQLYANLRGYDPSGQPAQAGEVVRRFLDALGVPPAQVPADLDGQTGLYRSLLAGRRMMIIADNADDPAQVRPLLPGTPGCLVVVTSRSPMTGLAAIDGARLLNLDVPTPAQATELLLACLGLDRMAAERDVAARLIRLCGRLPLALAVIGARATASGWPLTVLADELADTRTRLSALGLRDDAANVGAVFSWSYRKLTPTAAQVFRLLGIHPGPDISVAATASLAASSRPGARAALAELAAVGLVTERVPGRYVLHDLLRAYAADRAAAEEGDEARREVGRRLAGHYLYTAQAGERLLDSAEDSVALGPAAPGVEPEHIDDSGAALSWFAAERLVLLAVIRYLAASGLDRHAQQLTWTVTTFFDRIGRWPELLAAQRAALSCAEQRGDLTGQARTHRDLGRAGIHLGQLGTASSHLARAVDLSRRAGDRRGEARAWLGLSMVHGHGYKLEDSLSSSQRALVLAEAAGDPTLEAKASNNVAHAYAELGQPGQGLPYCRRALALYERISRPMLEAHAWDSLGFIEFQLGDPPAATVSYQRAISLFQQVGEAHARAQSLDRLGDVQSAAGHPRAAQASWQQALAILDVLAPAEASQLRGKLRQAG
ncbi:MAG TPA: tetratricopeptide repeat protein [Streptosporangiaceae bacterium]|nr:tetratricopeptide repeat protein [Streptosporangiaceae bacterium]